MNEPAWKKLADELKARGVESEHANQLKARAAALISGGSLEAEMISEMAASLRRSEDKILAVLLELEVLGKRIDDARARGNERESAKAVARFNQRRQDAKAYVHDLLIQREAIGFRNNEALARLYPIPSARS